MREEIPLWTLYHSECTEYLRDSNHICRLFLILSNSFTWSPLYNWTTALVYGSCEFCKITTHLYVSFCLMNIELNTYYLLVRTPPQSGPTMPMSRMAMGMNRAILCWRSVARESRAAGTWKTREETAAQRNTPYHISAHTQSWSNTSLHDDSTNSREILSDHSIIYYL